LAPKHKLRRGKDRIFPNWLPCLWLLLASRAGFNSTLTSWLAFKRFRVHVPTPTAPCKSPPPKCHARVCTPTRGVCSRTMRMAASSGYTIDLLLSRSIITKKHPENPFSSSHNSRLGLGAVCSPDSESRLPIWLRGWTRRSRRCAATGRRTPWSPGRARPSPSSRPCCSQSPRMMMMGGGRHTHHEGHNQQVLCGSRAWIA